MTLHDQYTPLQSDTDAFVESLSPTFERLMARQKQAWNEFVRLSKEADAIEAKRNEILSDVRKQLEDFR